MSDERAAVSSGAVSEPASRRAADRAAVIAAIERLTYSVESWSATAQEMVERDVVDAEELIAEVERAFGGSRGWIAFADRRPPNDYHGRLLVTNNIDARNRYGKMSHVWLVSMVHYHDDAAETINGYTLASLGEITAFAEPGDMTLRGLTHWRPAIAEEFDLETGR